MFYHLHIPRKRVGKKPFGQLIVEKLKEDYEGLECNGKFIMQLNNFCSLHEIINKNCKGLMLLSINLLVIQC